MSLARRARAALGWQNSNDRGTESRGSGFTRQDRRPSPNFRSITPKEPWLQKLRRQGTDEKQKPPYRPLPPQRPRNLLNRRPSQEKRLLQTPGSQMVKETTPDRDFAAREATTKRTTLTYRRNTEMIMSESFKIPDTSPPRSSHIQTSLRKTKRNDRRWIPRVGRNG
jgi:hypothetical protein